MIRAVAPARSERAAPALADLPVTVAECRGPAGLYGDTSDDALLADFVLAGADLLGDLIGEPLASAAVKDWWRPGPGGRYRLSLPHDGEIALSAWRAGAAGPVVLDAALWRLDVSVSPAEIELTGVEFDTFPKLPLSCAYTAAGAFRTVNSAVVPRRGGLEQCAAALLWYVHTRHAAVCAGTPLPEGWERGLRAMLGTAARAQSA